MVVSLSTMKVCKNYDEDDDENENKMID